MRETLLHQPVLVEEVLRHLCIKKEGLYLDATVGAGGHAVTILEHLGNQGKLIGIDCDEQILHFTKEKLARFGERVRLFHGHYEEAPKFLSEAGVRCVDGILLDLGVSSFQLDTAERGFSFQREGPLDMRMDLGTQETATDLLHSLSEKELETLFWKWGEERRGRKVAQAIVRQRPRNRFQTTTELASFIEGLLLRTGRLHPATRIFQALRLAVNQELPRLERFLKIFPPLLSNGGRATFIAYHSLEDRLIKQSLLQAEREGVLRRITRKPIRPVEQEVRENPRSRSARLRVVEKL